MVVASDDDDILIHQALEGLLKELGVSDPGPSVLGALYSAACDEAARVLRRAAQLHGHTGAAPGSAVSVADVRLATEQLHALPAPRAREQKFFAALNAAPL